MEESLYDVLVKMLNAISPSGYEKPVLDVFYQSAKDCVDDIAFDISGNLIAHKKGQSDKRLMIMAHADEIGFMVTSVDENGYVYIQHIGGVDVSLLPGQQIVFRTSKGLLSGVVGKKAIHFMFEADNTKKVRDEDLWVDIGAMTKEEALSRIEIGDIGSYKPNAVRLSEQLITSKSLDDRIGLAVLLGVMHNLKHVFTDYDIYFVASVQEEIGFRGAITATSKILPEESIVIDVTHATDYPTGGMPCRADIKINSGAVIAKGPNINNIIGKNLLDIAKQKNILAQIEPSPSPTGTDAYVVQTSGTGVKTAVISIPCRYMHTPVEVVSLKDACSAIDLITAYCTPYI